MFKLKKILLFLVLLISLTLISCKSQVKLLNDCAKDIAKFEEKMEDSDGFVVDMNMKMLLDEDETFNLGMEYKMILDPFYVEMKVDDSDQEYHLIKVDDRLHNLELINGHYVAGRVGELGEFEEFLEVEDQLELKDLEHVEIEKIKNGYRINYDFFEYIEETEDETLKELLSSFNEEYIEDTIFRVDFIFGKDSLSIKELCELNLNIFEEKYTISIEFDFDIKIEEVKRITNNYWLGLDRMSDVLEDPNMMDVTGYSNFYFMMMTGGIVKIYLEEGVYAFEATSEEFTHILFDAEYNQFKTSTLYTLKEGYYYLYMYSPGRHYVTLIKY